MSGRSSERAEAPRPVVLVVDDDPQMRELVGEMLAAFGYEPILADGTASAAHSLATEPGIACAVIDIEMPGGNGVALARAINAGAPKLPIIMMSALTYDEIMRLVQDVTVGAILCKPFRLGDLRMATADVLRHAAAAQYPTAAPGASDAGAQQ